MEMNLALVCLSNCSKSGYNVNCKTPSMKFEITAKNVRDEVHSIVDQKFIITCPSQCTFVSLNEDTLYGNYYPEHLQYKDVDMVSGIETLLLLMHEGTLDLIFSGKVRCLYGVLGAWWEKTPFLGVLRIFDPSAGFLEICFRKMWNMDLIGNTILFFTRFRIFRNFSFFGPNETTVVTFKFLDSSELWFCKKLVLKTTFYKQCFKLVPQINSVIKNISGTDFLVSKTLILKRTC